MIAVAIDGPAGAGKSTIARAIAQELGYIYVDTGALYRAIGLYATAHEADMQDEERMACLLKDVKIELRFIKGVQRVFLNGYDVSEEIRHPKISMAASKVSALRVVRTFLFALQQNLAAEHNVVMDGRDIGTVVLPKAQVKLFLTAQAEDRARRRFVELTQKGISADYETVLEEVRQRDKSDENRVISPLCQAEDAILVDTTGNTLEQSIAQLLEIVKEKLKDVL